MRKSCGVKGITRPHWDVGDSTMEHSGVVRRLSHMWHYLGSAPCLVPCSVLRDHFWQCSRDHLCCQELNLVSNMEGKYPNPWSISMALR